MTVERNSQAEQMAHDSVLRTLAAQADAIWPAEQALFQRYGLAGEIQIFDVGCGSGEITARLASLYPDAKVLGIDILESAVEYARGRYANLAPRVTFKQGDASRQAIRSTSICGLMSFSKTITDSRRDGDLSCFVGWQPRAGSM